MAIFGAIIIVGRIRRRAGAVANQLGIGGNGVELVSFGQRPLMTCAGCVATRSNNGGSPRSILPDVALWCIMVAIGSCSCLGMASWVAARRLPFSLCTCNDWRSTDMACWLSTDLHSISSLSVASAPSLARFCARSVSAPASACRRNDAAIVARAFCSWKPASR